MWCHTLTCFLCVLCPARQQTHWPSPFRSPGLVSDPISWKTDPQLVPCGTFHSPAPPSPPILLQPCDTHQHVSGAVWVSIHATGPDSSSPDWNAFFKNTHTLPPLLHSSPPSSLRLNHDCTACCLPDRLNHWLNMPPTHPLSPQPSPLSPTLDHPASRRWLPTNPWPCSSCRSALLIALSLSTTVWFVF